MGLNALRSTAQTLSFYTRMQALTANNLANSETEAFKADVMSARLIGDATFPVPVTRTDLSQGTMQQTGRPLDLGRPAGDLLLVAAASLTLLLLTLLLLRHRAEAPRRRPAARPARAAVARRSADPVAPPSSALSRRLREAARDGERVPEVARRFRLSQDAVRVAIGRAAPTPAAPTGKSFRSRQAVLPARPRATPVPSRRSPYKALA